MDKEFHKSNGIDLILAGFHSMVAAVFMCLAVTRYRNDKDMSTDLLTTNNEEIKQLKAGRRYFPAGKMSATRMNRAFSTTDSDPRKDRRAVGRSPTRLSDRSPVKRNYSAS
ncbi:unnamed protein product [Linum trigynum]|uniref:Uncharacterized protein n=1 Tax=Linum trigynum TaxID=586398 RepID=A0AAV2CHF3_9ROSI